MKKCLKSAVNLQGFLTEVSCNSLECASDKMLANSVHFAPLLFGIGSF